MVRKVEDKNNTRRIYLVAMRYEFLQCSHLLVNSISSSLQIKQTVFRTYDNNSMIELN